MRIAQSRAEGPIRVCWLVAPTRVSTASDGVLGRHMHVYRSVGCHVGCAFERGERERVRSESVYIAGEEGGEWAMSAEN